MVLNTIKKLPRSKRSTGYVLTMVKRSNKVAIYSMDTGRHWEVVKVRPVNTPDLFVAHGALHTQLELYPSKEEWGRFGWTVESLAKAEELFNKFNQETV